MSPRFTMANGTTLAPTDAKLRLGPPTNIKTRTIIYPAPAVTQPDLGETHDEPEAPCIVALRSPDAEVGKRYCDI